MLSLKFVAETLDLSPKDIEKLYAESKKLAEANKDSALVEPSSTSELVDAKNWHHRFTDRFTGDVIGTAQKGGCVTLYHNSAYWPNGSPTDNKYYKSWFHYAMGTQAGNRMAGNQNLFLEIMTTTDSYIIAIIQQAVR